MFIAEFTKWNAINVGDPEYWFPFSMVNNKPMTTPRAPKSITTVTCSFFDCVFFAALRTVWALFFLPYFSRSTG